MDVQKTQQYKQQLAFYLEQITKIILNCKNNPKIDFYEQMIALKAIQKTLPQAMQNLIWLHNHAVSITETKELHEAQQALKTINLGEPNEPKPIS